MMRLSGSLYNSCVYEANNHYNQNNEYVGFGGLDLILKNHLTNPIYRLLPAQVQQQGVKRFHEMSKSFFQLLKMKRNNSHNESISMPKYKKKGHLRELIFQKQSFRIIDGKVRLSISKHLQKEHDVKFVYLDLPQYIQDKNIKQISITPTLGGSKMNIMYEQNSLNVDIDVETKKWASVDLGIDNLMTVTSNVVKPFIVSGKPLKSINKFFNKKIAKEKSSLMKNNKQYNSKRTNTLYTKRANKIYNEMHKISSAFVEYTLQSGIDTVIIGYNKGWKDKVQLGKKTNQKFVSIPYSRLIQYLQYKLESYGIKVVIQEESYTSKCSYFDDEPIKNNPTYKGIRTKRGLFKTGSGVLINADVNGSLNIARKYLFNSKNVVNDVALQPVDIGLVMNPLVLKLRTDSSLLYVNDFILNLQTETVKIFNRFNIINTF